MANHTSLQRPPAGERYDPTAIDATGATLGHVLTAVSDGSGGQRAGYAALTGGSGGTSTRNADAFTAARQAVDDARMIAGTSTPSAIDELQVQLLSQFYGA